MGDILCRQLYTRTHVLNSTRWLIGRQCNSGMNLSYLPNPQHCLTVSVVEPATIKLQVRHTTPWGTIRSTDYPRKRLHKTAIDWLTDWLEPRCAAVIDLWDKWRYRSGRVVRQWQCYNCDRATSMFRTRVALQGRRVTVASGVNLSLNMGRQCQSGQAGDVVWDRRS